MSDIVPLNRIFRAKEDVGLQDENIVGTEEHTAKVKELEEAQVVLSEWQEGDTLYNALFNRITGYRDFYLGDISQQWKNAPEGELQLVFNIGAAVIDLFSYILGNSPPDVQFKVEGNEPMQRVRADFGEDLTRKIFDNAKFALRFKDGVKTQFLVGWTWLVWIWNKQNKDGGEKGTLELSVLNPFTTRVKLSSTDSEKIDSVITTERISLAECYRRYKYEALPDNLDPFLPKSILSQDDGMVTVFRRYGPNSTRTVVNGRQVAISRHDYGFTPAVQINNLKVPNDAYGYSEIQRWQGTAQELNELLSAASEIARDLGYPPIIEENNALQGRKIDKWRGRKIPVKNMGTGQSLRYMVNTADIGGILKQTELLLDLFHFITLMPKAAAGIFEPSVTSGFQAKLAMQPATLTTESRKIDWEAAVKSLVKMGIKILEKENPEALKVKTGKDTVKFEDLSLHEMQIVWPNNLPIDIAREIQNLVLGMQNNLTSVTQAIDKYNVLMGMGSPSDSEDQLNKEAEDPKLNPDRATKYATAKKALEALGQTVSDASGKLNDLRNQMNGENGPLPTNIREANRQANPTNLARSAASPLPEEQRAVSTTNENVPLESTGGVLPQPGGGQ